MMDGSSRRSIERINQKGSIDRLMIDRSIDRLNRPPPSVKASAKQRQKGAFNTHRTWPFITDPPYQHNIEQTHTHARAPTYSPVREQAAPAPRAAGMAGMKAAAWLAARRPSRAKANVRMAGWLGCPVA
jgi:hypothetical protein